MTETSVARAIAPMSATGLVLRYLGFLAGGVILLNVIFWGLETYFNVKPGNAGALGIILMWAAASGIGRVWYNREQARPASGRAWAVALYCALATYLVQAVLIGLIYGGLVMQGQRSALPAMNGRDQALILGFFAALAVLELLIIRLGIGMGAKEADKQAKRRAEKAAA